MDQTCLAEIGFTASDLTGKRCTVYRTVLCRLFYRSMGAAFQDGLAWSVESEKPS